MFEEILIWLRLSVKSLKYGEIVITIKVHDGRPTIIERTTIEREKTNEEFF